MAGCKHCSIDHDYFDGEFSRHRCSTANDEIVRLTRELEVERMCHQSASNANHDKRLEVDRLRAALAFAASAIKSGESWTAHCDEVIGEALRGAAETKAAHDLSNPVTWALRVYEQCDHLWIPMSYGAKCYYCKLTEGHSQCLYAAPDKTKGSST